jgi:uncharacterized membrane protein
MPNQRFRTGGFMKTPVLGTRALAASSLLAFTLLATAISANAQVDSGPYKSPLITQNIDEGKLIALPGNKPPQAKPENDHGAVADDFPMEHLLLQLKRSPEQEQALQQFTQELHTPGSANFHQWLTAQEFGYRFGLAQQDLNTISRWLQSHGLKVNLVYPNGTMIDFSGNARQVREAFRTEIHNVDSKGEKHISNMSDPQIPAALAPVVSGIVSLNDFRPRVMHKLRQPRTSFTFDSGGATYAVVPGDLATIYNLNPLFAAGYSGQGQTIVVIEDTDVFSATDWNVFRSSFGLSSYTSASFTLTHPAPVNGANNCGAPGIIAPNDAEAILDAEWASAAAPSAAIEMASCADTATTFGGLIAIENLLNAGNQPPAIMSISYGQCETVNGAAANAAYNAIYQQAVTEGVSVYVAAGDSGAAGCDNSVAQATNGIAVNAFASTPYNVAVGGTDFSDSYSRTNTTYWNTTNSSTFASALSYVPEIPWNDSCAGVLLSSYEGYGPTFPPGSFCNDPFGSFLLTTVAGGGGPSGCATGSPSNGDVVSGSCQGWPKPSWQSVLGNPSDGVRDTPDVSLFAADGIWGHYYVFCWSNIASGGAACTGDPSGWSGAGGTSFASPIAAGIQALINQRTGSRQGNPNPVYYQLAASEYGSAGSTACNSNNGNGVSGACVFYDVTLGDMDVDCAGSANCYSGVLSTSDSSYMPAYPAATGWDFATGIGTINATNLVNNWPPAVPGFSLSASPSSLTVQQGSSGSSTITIAPQTGFNGTVSFSASGLPSGVTASFSPNGTTTQSTLTLSASPLATAGTFNVTITGISGSVASATTLNLTITSKPWIVSGTITGGSGATVTLSGGANATTTADLSGNYAFNNVINGSYTVAAIKAGYVITPSSQNVTVSGGNLSGVNFAANLAVPQSGWSLKYVDSQETSCVNGAATLGFDGNPATIWQTLWCTLSPPPPHEIQINLGFSYNLIGFSYLPRQDNTDNGKIKQYEFYVSSDGNNWTLVSSGVLMTTAGDKSSKTVMFNPIAGQYVRLREITEINGNPWATMAELNVLVSSLPIDFSISANPAAVSVAEGTSGSVAVSTALIGGFNNALTLSATGGPAGVSVTFNPPSLPSPGSGTSNVSFAVGASVPFGTYPITITAGGGGVSHSTTVSLIVTPDPIPQSGWTLKYVDSQESSCVNGAATLGFDGNPATIWQTQWCSASPAPPHEIQINLGYSYNLVGFTYLPRQDSSDNGKIKQYEFYVSSDGNSWTLVSSGVLMTTAGDKSAKTIMFSAIQAQYVRLREISEINGNAWATMAELNVLASSLPVDFSISASPAMLTLPESSSGTATITTTTIGAFNNALALSVSGVPSGVSVTLSPSSMSSPGSGTSSAKIAVSSSAAFGSYPITFTATGGGISHSTTLALTVTPDVIPQSGWTLKYVDSQETSCTNGAATNAFDGNPATLWQTQWCPSSPGPPHEIQINLGGTYNLVGFTYLPRQDSSDNGKIKQYEFYISSDGNNWTLVSSGVLMSTPGDKSAKTATFNAALGQYVRLREITEINGNPWATMAELNLLSTSVGPVPDFSLTAKSNLLSIGQGYANSTTINTTVNGGFNNVIALSASGVPAGVSVTFSPSSLPSPGSGASNVSFSVAASVPFGNYPIAITAIGGGVTHTATVTLTVTADVIPQSGWTLKYVDSQETSCTNGAATLGFDGNPATIWQTQWCPSSPAPPHEIQINLGTSYDVVGFTYLPRQDGSDNGKVKQYEFYVSSDGNNWTLASSGLLMTTPGDKSAKTVMFSPMQGEYIRLREISEINGNPWATMAELNVLTTSSAAAADFSLSATPAALTVPRNSTGSSTIVTSVSGSFDNTITLTASGQPAGVNITFNPASLVAPGPGTATMNVNVGNAVAGIYPITITASGGGISHTTVVTLTVVSATIPQTGWTLKYVDSQETSCTNGAATLAFDGNPATIWQTQWCTSSPAPPHEIQINLGASYNLVGFTYLPRQDSSDNGKIKQYEFYVSSDGNNWTLVSSGVLMTTPGDKSVKTVTFNPTAGQYVRLREISEINGNPWATMAELNLLSQ